ncbi:hypothetical protein [Parafrankia sp. Ea1.12]|uniref:hypothetical protein n=1 Tax=unclassified Parafrankia TaxID=2994368 RepID=UPI000DD314BE|nr:hypothetical protein E0504_30215 [Parafrankia sp. BMG5.11]
MLLGLLGEDTRGGNDLLTRLGADPEQARRRSGRPAAPPPGRHQPRRRGGRSASPARGPPELTGSLFTRGSSPLPVPRGGELTAAGVQQAVPEPAPWAVRVATVRASTRRAS